MKSVVFWVGLLGLAAAVPLKERLEADLARLRRDVAAAQGDSSLSAALSTGGNFDHLESHGQLNAPSGIFQATMTSSGDTTRHQYYRGQIGTRDVDLILTTKTSGLTGSKSYELCSREFKAGDAESETGVSLMTSLGGGSGFDFFRSHCRVNGEESETSGSLTCRIFGGGHTVVALSPRGLKVIGPSGTHVFWRYDYMRVLSVDEIVGSVTEFVHVYTSEMTRALYGGAATPEAIAKKYESARRGLSRSLSQYLKDWDAKKGANAKPEDKETLESLVQAVSDQYTSIGKWAGHMSQVYDTATREIAAPPRFDAGNVVRRNKQAFEELRISWRETRPTGDAKSDITELDPRSQALLKQGTGLIGTTLADELMRHSSVDAQSGPHAGKLRHAHESGMLAEYLGNVAQDAVMASKAARGTVYLAANLDTVLDEAMQSASDWFMGLVGLSKKNDKALASIEDGSLNPGEAQIAEAMFNAKAGKEADELEKKAERLQIASTGFRFSPQVNYVAAAMGARDPASLLQSIDLGTGLSLTKGKTNVLFNVDVKLDSPLDPQRAKATVNVRLDGTHTTASGSVINSGVAVKTVVLGALKPEKEVEEIVVSTYIRYKNTRGFSTGFTGTLTVPLNDDANSRTRFGNGRELAVRYDVAYRAGRHNFVAYADLTLSEKGDTELGSGLKYEYRIKDDLSFYTGVQFNQGTDQGFSNRESEAQGYIGIMWRF